MEKKNYTAPDAPKPVGPYSHAIEANGFLYTSGQTGVDPATGKLTPGGVQDEARQTFANLKAVLAAAGVTFDNVVKATVFLADMNDFAAVNEVYAQTFVAPFPARSCVQVARLPLGAQVEIELIASLNK